MLKTLCFGFPRFQSSFRCSTVANTSENSGTTTWDIMVAVALQRFPVIAPQLTDVEKNYLITLKKVEEENSLKNNFELRHAKDEILLRKRADLEAQGKELSELDEEIGITASLQHDEWLKKAEAVKKEYLSKTVAEEQNLDLPVTSLERKLHKKLYLLTQQTFHRCDGYKSPWIFPQTMHRPGETLRQTAERCMGEIVVRPMRVAFSSNAPFSMIGYRYPKGLKRDQTTGATGAKVFFYSALIDPNSDFSVNEKEVCSYKWLDIEELQQFIRSRRYRNAISPLLLS
ncbi:hypothetical protein AB6A40_005063 [Gnathostoma spinigerum]|uniref:39S ribosomal protein L46, mitochondrial n=1 Tax=Gnathostoma spinigerum TaxID=75299 RepID=A0ABD6EJM6_9BILA